MSYEAIYRHPGNEMEYTATGADISAGEVIVAGGIIGIAKNDIAEDDTGILYIDGAFDVDMAAVDVEQGDQAFWDESANKVTTTEDSGTNIRMGYFLEDASSGTSKVLVKLERGDSGHPTPTATPTPTA